MILDWKQVQDRLRHEGQVSGPREALLCETRLLAFSENGLGAVAKLSLKSKLSASMLERLLLPDLKRTIESLSGRPTLFEIEVESRQECFPVDQLALSESEEPLVVDQVTAIRFKERLSLDPGMTFAALVETEENRFAAAAAKEFSCLAPVGFSQLTLHGSVGVGKSHLLHATGLSARDALRGLRVKIVTGDEFISDFQLALVKKNMGDFKKRYRLETDLLLVDDLHSLCRAKATQEELFNLMNHYASTGRRMVITCDRPIHSLEGLEERIKSRLNGGLVIAIEQPSEESRRRILAHKLAEQGIPLEAETVTQLARKAGPCIRSLEGVVHNFTMLARTGCLTPDRVRNLAAQMREVAPKLTAQQIMTQVASAHHLTLAALTGRARVRDHITARKECMRRLKEELGLSLSEIGRLFQRDHSTVLNALKV